MKKIYWIVIFLIGPGCASSLVTVPGDSQKQYLFPYGKYQHQVSLNISPDSSGKPLHYQFSGIVKIDAQFLKLAAFSAFGTTVFTITEDRKTGKIEDQIYVSQIKAHEDELLRYYQILRQLLLLAQDPKLHEGSTLHLEPSVEVTLGFFDEHHVLKSMQIRAPHVMSEIEVTEYDFK